MTVVDAVLTRNFVSSIADWNAGNFNLGGALNVFGQARIAVRSSAFSGNGAELGGAAFLRGNHTITVDDCVFENNMGFIEGGAVVVSVRNLTTFRYYKCNTFVY